jgi:penicillin-binding protein 1A
MRQRQRINLVHNNPVTKLVIVTLVFFAIITLPMPFVVYWYFAHDLPDLTKITGYRPGLINEVYSFDGKLVGEFGSTHRKLIPYEEIPTHVRNAFIAVEDKRFFEHEGIDLRRIIGALLRNIREWRLVEGASTITQQVVKNLVLSPERSVSRKIKEAILAYRMEKNLSKEEILYIYFNHIYFGDGAYGIEAASRNYFGKSARDINLAEAAFLAALPKAPSYYYPREHFAKAKARQELILRVMEEGGFITKEQRKEAEQYPIKLVPRSNVNFQVAPYFVEYVRQYIENKFGTKALLDGGFTVFTTLDVDLSLGAQWALRRGILELEARRGRQIVLKHLNEEKEIDKFIESQKIDKIEKGKSYECVVTEVTDVSPAGVFEAKVHIGRWEGKLKFGVSSPFGTAVEGLSFPLSKKYAPLNGYDGISLVPFKLRIGDVIKVKVTGEEEGVYHVSLDFQHEFQGALLAMDTNGYVKALVGGFDFLDSQFNRATQAQRQPGSSFKPIVYAAALDKGYTETTIVYDAPVEIKNWFPQNYDGSYLGGITLREALAKSRNLASVRILLDIDPNYVVSYAKRFGFTSNLNPYPSLALGGSEVSLMEMVKAFNVFATGGKLVQPKFILRIYDRDGRLIEDNTEGRYVSAGEAEKAEREKKRLEIIKQIARSIGRDFTKEEKEETESIKEDVLAGSKTNENTAFQTPQEFLSLLRSNSIKFTFGTGEQIISPEIAYIMTDLLQAVVKEGTARRALELTSLAPIAGKTGTTNDFTDAWFIGFSPRIVAGVWVGRDDHKPIGKGEVGGRAALPIWMEFMKEALEKFPGGDFKVPDGIQFVSTPYGLIPYTTDSISMDNLEETQSGYESNYPSSESGEEESGGEIDFLIRR